MTIIIFSSDNTVIMTRVYSKTLNTPFDCAPASRCAAFKRGGYSRPMLETDGASASALPLVAPVAAPATSTAISLDECLDLFSKEEMLDEENAW